MDNIEAKVPADVIPALIRYDPETGKLFWRHRPPYMFRSFGNSHDWNERWAGTEAFTPLNSAGYRKGSIMGKRYLAHHVAWASFYGRWPEQSIDHINGDRADNRISNLRTVTSAENQRNLRKGKNNTTGVVGVYRTERGKPWVARICVRNKLIGLGRFDTIEEAAAARKSAEVLYGFHPNHGA